MFQIIISPRTPELDEMLINGPEEDTALISIASQRPDDPGVNERQGRVLRLCFNDVDRPEMRGSMSPTQALMVSDFVYSIEDTIDCLIVNCDAGSSRSPAVAAAILRGLGEDDMDIWRSCEYRPNTYCYAMTLQAFGIIADDIAARREISETAFSEAVRYS